jgi:hypothetical protein
MTLLLPAAVWLALSGCDNNYAQRQADPFMGIHASSIPGPPSPAATGSGGAAATQTASTGATALPGTHSMTSPAALAGGTLPAPENPRGDLRIDAPPVVPASLPGGAAARGAAPSGVQVGGPEPVPESTSRIAPLAAPGGGFQPVGAVTPGTPTPAASVPLSTPVANMTFEDALKYLKQRGVIWQRLETWGDQGQWKFQCSLPIPGSPNIYRTYVTDPLPYDPLTAVRIVLDKIEKDQR